MTKTWLDRKTNDLFNIMLRHDGRSIVYCRGEKKKRLRVLVQDVSEEVVATRGLALARKSKVFCIPAEKFPDKEPPMVGDYIVHEGWVYDVIKGTNSRYFDYEDVSQQVLVVVGQKMRESKKE